VTEEELTQSVEYVSIYDDVSQFIRSTSKSSAATPILQTLSSSPACGVDTASDDPTPSEEYFVPPGGSDSVCRGVASLMGGVLTVDPVDGASTGGGAYSVDTVGGACIIDPVGGASAGVGTSSLAAVGGASARTNEENLSKVETSRERVEHSAEIRSLF